MTHDLPVKHHTERINTAGKHSQSVNLQCSIESWHTESNRAPVHPFFPAGLAASSPLQPSLGRSGTSPAFNPSRSSSPQAKGGASTPSPHKQLAQGHHHHHHSGHGAVRKGKGPGGPGARWCTHTHECALTHMHAQLSRHRTHTHAEKLTYSHCDPDRRPLRLAQQLIGPPSLTHTHTQSFKGTATPPPASTLLVPHFSFTCPGRCTKSALSMFCLRCDESIFQVLFPRRQTVLFYPWQETLLIHYLVVTLQHRREPTRADSKGFEILVIASR